MREHDPRLALDGGADGLDAYRTILAGGETGSWLRKAVCVLEIGYDQEPALRRLAAESGFEVVLSANDLAGNPRCLALKRT